MQIASIKGSEINATLAVALEKIKKLSHSNLERIIANIRSLVACSWIFQLVFSRLPFNLYY